MNKRNIAGYYFVITASDFRWESGLPDDPDDLCLHGMARANIGEETVEYDDTNLTAASLHLLRTINADTSLALTTSSFSLTAGTMCT